MALLAGPADAQRDRRSKRQRRSSKPVKPEVTAAAPEPEVVKPPAAKVEPRKPAAKAEPAKPGDAARRESRIEFDERMVQGQSAAGAIYLFQRADAAFSSMIAPPESFRERTLHTVYVDGVPGAAGASP